MKLQLFFATLLFSIVGYAQVGIGIQEPHSSAILDVTSSNRGFLPPRMTTTERNAITNPAEGLVIYNSNSNSQCLQVYRNVTNGNGWFDICCPGAVSQLSNFSSAGVLFSPNKFFAGSNGSGGSVADGGEVGSIGPVDLSGFGAQYPSVAYFNAVDGSEDPGFIVTQTLLDNNINEYTASAFLTKNGDFGTKSTNESDHLVLNTGVTTANDYEGDLTLTVVARYNAIPGGPFKGFFAVGQGVTSGSFQLGNASSGRYRIAVGNTALWADNSAGANPVPIDTAFHLFNAVYNSATDEVTLYIDGKLQQSTIIREMRLNDAIRLLTNRNGQSSTNGSIAYFGVDPVVKTQAEISSLSKGISCLFDEL